MFIDEKESLESAMKQSAEVFAVALRSSARPMSYDVHFIVRGVSWGPVVVAAHLPILARADLCRVCSSPRWRREHLEISFDDDEATRRGFEDIIGWLYGSSFLHNETTTLWIERLAVARYLGVEDAVAECAKALASTQANDENPIDRALTARDAARKYFLPGLELASRCMLRVCLSWAPIKQEQFARISRDEIVQFLGRSRPETLDLEAWFLNDQARYGLAKNWLRANVHRTDNYDGPHDRRGVASLMERIDLQHMIEADGAHFDTSVPVNNISCSQGDKTSITCHDENRAELRVGFAFESIQNLECESSTIWHFCPFLEGDISVRLGISDDDFVCAKLVFRPSNDQHICLRVVARLQLALRFFHSTGSTVYLDANVTFDNSSFERLCSSSILKCCHHTELQKYVHFGKLLVAAKLVGPFQSASTNRCRNSSLQRVKTRPLSPQHSPSPEYQRRRLYYDHERCLVSREDPGLSCPGPFDHSSHGQHN